MDRRQFLVLGSAGVAASTVLASTLCAGQRTVETLDGGGRTRADDGRLKVRPRAGKLSLAAGTHAVPPEVAREVLA